MSNRSESEAAALEQAGPLLRFAAERVKDLDPELSLAIAQAREDATNDKWTPATSQSFWTAYAKLCDLIWPVSMDCLEAAQRNVTTCGWLPFSGKKLISRAEQSSRRYTAALAVLLAVILVLQLYAWVGQIVSQKINDTIATADTRLLQPLEIYSNLVNWRSQHQWGPDQQAQASKLNSYTPSVITDCQRIDLETKRLMDWTSFKFARSLASCPYEINPTAISWDHDFEGAFAQLNKARVTALQVQEQSSLIVGVLGSFILPVLFGTIGAVAYVIRTISDQIRTTTFSLASPARHMMRVALGALSGVVVGLFGRLPAQLSLEPLAIAFLAGYGVEALFSMFDGLIDKFRQSSAERSPLKLEAHVRPHQRKPNT